MVAQKIKNGLFAGLLAVVGLFTVGMLAACGKDVTPTPPTPPTEITSVRDVQLSDGSTFGEAVDAFTETFNKAREDMLQNDFDYVNGRAGVLSNVLGGIRQAVVYANPSKYVISLNKQIKGEMNDAEKGAYEKIYENANAYVKVIVNGNLLNIDDSLLKILKSGDQVKLVYNFESNDYAIAEWNIVRGTHTWTDSQSITIA